MLREHRDHGGSLADAAVHEVDEIGAGHEIPGLQHCAVTCGFKLPGNPGGPALVRG